MADTITKYGKAGKHFADGDIDFVNDTIKIFLLKSTYTPDYDTHEHQSDLTLATHEIDTTSTYTKGTGYTLEGKTALAYDSVNNYTAFDATDVTIEGVTAADITYAAIVDTQSGAEATNPLIALVTFDAAKRVFTGGQLKISWNASGIFAMQGVG